MAQVRLIVWWFSSDGSRLMVQAIDRGVTVVIPTAGRHTVRRALASVLHQSHAPSEVIVCCGVDRAEEVAARIEGFDCQLLVCEASLGGALRQLGTDAANAEWVAYLDDDDEWLDDRLRLQLSAAQGSDRPVIMSGRFRYRHAATGRVSAAYPKHLIDGESVDEYLFAKRRSTRGRNLLHTSTLLVPSDLARAVGWDQSLPRHQDWDFLLRAAQVEPRVHVMQVDEPLVLVETGSEASVSASPSWRPSYEWVKGLRGVISDEAYCDLIVGQCVRYALASRDLRAVRDLLREAHSVSRVRFSSLATATTGLVPRRLVERRLAGCRRDA